MNRRNILIAAALAILVVVGGLIYFGNRQAENDGELLTKVERGEFKIVITTSGELEAKNSTEVRGPNGLRQARLWQVNIEDIVPEGTTVKKGDYVASLDRSELQDRISETQNKLQQNLSEYTQTKLDTALTLREARDQLVNLEFAVEEQKLVVEQSQYEPPATIKQAEIDLEKAHRALKQAKENYQLQRQKAVAQMQEAAAELAEAQNEADFLQKLADQFMIKAPEDGMVIYKREYNGKKRAAGSTVGAWDPVVATLPDLSKMLSRTYVNEVDIRQVKVGQPVNIGLDAYPDKKLSGKVISVANVGEQRPNSDAKVFEVNVEIFETDTTLRPAMTTSNDIIAEVLDDVLYIPLESLHSQGDSLSFVYLKEGMDISRQQVRVGKANANEIVVQAGLEEGDQLYLSVPQNGADRPLVLLEEVKENEEKLSSSVQ
ncbi:efflux RND transporter periplasmic adaptor subunit [Nafulsella turpanensis]|uniref:efflux RND transporter periplasmic adaptor subunit n=1 Tax=Nafulsella turpanensis TaxID=1265690 RepID=UPI00034BA26A|nr:efflux RND transporter periplasmic adaptor subunit [Nafulsella turpanensis]